MASFGFSISDIISLGQLTTRAYQGWKTACGDYAEITSQLKTINTLTKRLRDEAKAPHSLIKRGSKDHAGLALILDNSKADIAQLNNIIVKYKGASRSRKHNWDRLRLGNKDLGPLHRSLTLHVTQLGAYLQTIGLSSLGRIEDGVNELPEMTRAFDRLAAEVRAGRREGSVMTAYEDDDTAVWREFRRELIGEGFSSEAVRKHKSDLKAHLKRLHEDGLLEEETPVTLSSNHLDNKSHEQTSQTAKDRLQETIVLVSQCQPGDGLLEEEPPKLSSSAHSRQESRSLPSQTTEDRLQKLRVRSLQWKPEENDDSEALLWPDWQLKFGIGVWITDALRETTVTPLPPSEGKSRCCDEKRSSSFPFNHHWEELYKFQTEDESDISLHLYTQAGDHSLALLCKTAQPDGMFQYSTLPLNTLCIVHKGPVLWLRQAIHDDSKPARDWGSSEIPDP